MRKTILVLLLLAVASVATAGEEVFEKAYSMEGVTKVSVENVNGKIEAYAWDRPYLKVRAVASITRTPLAISRSLSRPCGTLIATSFSVTIRDKWAISEAKAPIS